MKVTVIKQPVRGCGKRKPGGFYLVTAEPTEDGVLPAFSDIEAPIPMQRAPHRGPLVVDGDKILARMPEDAWLAGSSADTLEKKKGDAWAKDMFGMTFTKRMETGECRGAKTPEEALESLAKKVTCGKRVLDYIRIMTVNKVAELPNAAGPFMGMIKNIQEYSMSYNTVNLVYAVGKIWSLADAVQPRHRPLVIDNLARMLTLMGLAFDAVELKRRYPYVTIDDTK